MPYINGAYVVTPQAIVTVNTSGLSAPAAAPGLGLLLIGPATDGKPNTAISIASPADAVQKLKGGDLLQACLLAFTPGGALQGPGSLTVIRPELATQATSTIKSGATTEINLTTTAYGTLANQAKWSVQAGSTSGYLVTLGQDFVGPGGQTYPLVSQDNTGLGVLSIYYSGTGTSPNVTVTDSALTCTATTSDTGGTVNFTSTMTVQQLVNAINQFPGWVAAVLDPNPSDKVMPGTTAIPALLDNVSAVTVGTTSATAHTLRADVAAVVNWINATGSYFTATRAASATSLSTSATYTYATGGTTPTAANSDWQNAFTTAQSLTGIALVCPVAGASAIWSQADAHCKYMQGIGQPRRAYVGDLLGQTLAAEQSAVLALNSNRTSLVWCGSKGTDYNGNQTTFAPYLVAAQVAGGRAGTPITGKVTASAIGSSGLEIALTPANVSAAVGAGICCLAVDSTGAVVVAWDRTTWLSDGNSANVENMTGLAIDVVTQDLNQTLKQFVGLPITNTMLGHAKSALLSRLNLWWQQGLVVTGNGQPPPDSSVSLSASGTTISGQATVAIIQPGNYIALTLYATAYAGVA